MNFSYRKAMTLKPQKEKAFSTFLLAFLVASVLFVPYIIAGKGYFIFYGDFNVQQIPFYQKCHAAIKAGNIFWSWTTDLGANFVGSYGYYLLGSPFFWITIPFPNWIVPYLMGPLLILKFSCAAWTAYYYIRRFTRTPQAARIGGLLYAFSGFSIYNIFFNQFHESIVFFPLLLLSLELLLTENRRFGFALAVAICALVNYFLFFGMVVFTVIYFFVRLFSGAIRVRFSRFLVFVFEAMLGLGIAMFLLLPSCLAILNNGRVWNFLLGWNAIFYGKEQIYGNIIECFFFPPDIPARPVFFPGAEVKWSSLGGWLPLFSMTGVFVWFGNRKGHWLKRMIGICIFMSMIPILNSAFYAFNTAYYARWFYMPILMMCLATVSLTEDSRVNWSSGYRWVLGITLAITLAIGFFPQKNADGDFIFGLYTQSEDGMYVFRFWLTCAIAILSLLLFGFLLKQWKKDRAAFYKAATVWVCIFSAIYGNVFLASGRSHSYDPKEIMIDQLIEGKVSLGESDGFRVDVYDGVDNTSMYLDLPGINAFHSVVPASIMEFYQYVGVERSVASRPETSQPALRPLLSVKYLLNRKNGDSFLDDDGETLMPDYEYVKTESGYYIYENNNYIPYGFSYESYMTSSFCDSYSASNRAALMLKAILLTDEQIQRYGDLLTDIEDRSLQTHEEDGVGILSLTDSAMRSDCAKLRETAADSFQTDNTGFTATVTRDRANLVFFSVPYDDGWTAYVNGSPVQIERVNVGFMAVKVEAGTSTIRFDYQAPGLVTGLTVTGSACVVMLLYLLTWGVFKKQRPDDTHYPEGEILLKTWRAQELREAEQAIRLSAVSARKSLLDNDSGSSPPPRLQDGFSGGFTIDPNSFNDE